ncbi:MAG: hypothetical protein AAB581_03085, partial [Patescibacteria group bacterium]
MMERLKKILMAPVRLVGAILKFILVPEGARVKAAYTLLVIFIVAILAAGFNFPDYWDRSADRINAAAHTKIPHFYRSDFKLGLALQGGTHLVYVADLSTVAP